MRWILVVLSVLACLTPWRMALAQDGDRLSIDTAVHTARMRCVNALR